MILTPAHNSLDFPIDQNANRHCYEKASYTDTGETQEQSEGEIVLALYEKRIPPFVTSKSSIRSDKFTAITRKDDSVIIMRKEQEG